MVVVDGADVELEGIFNLVLILILRRAAYVYGELRVVKTVPVYLVLDCIVGYIVRVPYGADGGEVALNLCGVESQYLIAVIAFIVCEINIVGIVVLFFVGGYIVAVRLEKADSEVLRSEVTAASLFAVPMISPCAIGIIGK